MGQGWPFQTPAPSLVWSRRGSGCVSLRSPSAPHPTVPVSRQRLVSGSRLLALPVNRLSEPGTPPSWPSSFPIPPASPRPLLQASPDSGLWDGAGSWEASLSPPPCQEPARGSSAQRKSGVGSEGVYGCDEGGPVRVCVNWRMRGASVSKWCAGVREPLKVPMYEACARQTVCDRVWGRGA